ncbi:SHOCT-like domain-containing protein [Fictibacillus phosphorivorans]|uniref:SHOCT-like domain-containing protein n=1 Tax=Fictibacillus phosphorivorans TaxID=1221500 RepID=UPI003CF23CE6
MKSEIEKVLTMVQEGKIDTDKGSELIQVLQEKEQGTTVKPLSYTSHNSSNYIDKTLKIRVVSESDNVNVNLPIKLVKVVLAAGHNIALKIPQSEQYVKDIDINLILEAIENELDGQIVDVKSANGDTVSITIE